MSPLAKSRSPSWPAGRSWTRRRRELVIIGFMLRVHLLMKARDGPHFLSLRMACCERIRRRMDGMCACICDAQGPPQRKQTNSSSPNKLCKPVVSSTTWHFALCATKPCSRQTEKKEAKKGIVTACSSNIGCTSTARCTLHVGRVKSSTATRMLTANSSLCKTTPNLTTPRNIFSRSETKETEVTPCSSPFKQRMHHLNPCSISRVTRLLPPYSHED
jgi:hypothetical protein